MTEDQAFDFATTEYKEISQNVRESWSYTTTLLRQYLLIQILLLSLVGLVYSAISTGGIPVKGSLQTASVSGTAHSQTLIAPPIKGPTQTLGPADASNTAASNTAVDILMGEKDLSKEAKTKRILRNGAIAILIFIGGSFSLGAWSQSSRIFQKEFC